MFVYNSGRANKNTNNTQLGNVISVFVLAVLSRRQVYRVSNTSFVSKKNVFFIFLNPYGIQK